MVGKVKAREGRCGRAVLYQVCNMAIEGEVGKGRRRHYKLKKGKAR